MMTESRQPPETVSDLEQEGIPDLEGMFPGQAAAGGPSEGPVAPGDLPKGVEESGVTAAEERAGEPLSLRRVREEPDPAVDDDAIAVAHDLLDTPSLVEPADGSLDDEEGDLATGMDYDDAAPSAEEAAVHVVDEDEAPGLSWDESPDYAGDEAPGGGAGEEPRV